MEFLIRNWKSSWERRRISCIGFISSAFLYSVLGFFALFGVKPKDLSDAIFRSQRKTATLTDELNVLMGTPAKVFFNQDYEIKQILKDTGRADRYEAITV